MRAAAVRIYLPSPSGFFGIGETGNVARLVVASGGDDGMFIVRIRVWGNALVRTIWLEACKSELVSERNGRSIGVSKKFGT